VRRGGERLADNDRFQNITKLDGKLVVEIPESVIRYFGLEENAELEFIIDKERTVIKACKPLFRAL
jgi:bifunctional DNA-binding transcriptional regulator/antitoxin component of YhaV-PrlF toxin-antitoxin module